MCGLRAWRRGGCGREPGPGFANSRWVQRRGQQRARRAARRLATLGREEREEPLVAPVAGGSGMRIIEAVVDSGAEDSVTPSDIFQGAVAPSPMVREGRSCRAATRC